MTPIEIARERVIASALSFVASRTYIEVSDPRASDDAELEIRSAHLDWQLQEWAEASLGTNGDVHLIQFGEFGWVIQHPLHERANGVLFDCEYSWKNQEAPVKFGRFVLLEGNVLGREVD